MALFLLSVAGMILGITIKAKGIRRLIILNQLTRTTATTSTSTSGTTITIPQGLVNRIGMKKKLNRTLFYLIIAVAF